MKCRKGPRGFISILDKNMYRSGFRDHIEAALGEVRDLYGEVRSEWAIWSLSKWFGDTAALDKVI